MSITDLSPFVAGSPESPDASGAAFDQAAARAAFNAPLSEVDPEIAAGPRSRSSAVSATPSR